jgi:ABC-type uncharacterized transport system substrate-binding protein
LGDADRLHRYAAELVALAPDVVLAGGTPAVGALQQATGALPIVFANVNDPVGLGYVASLARSGRNDPQEIESVLGSVDAVAKIVNLFFVQALRFERFLLRFQQR